MRLHSLRGLMLCAACAVVLTAAGCYEHSKCKTVPASAVASPDGKRKAVISNYVCRPDTDDVLGKHVSIDQSSPDIYKRHRQICRIEGDLSVNVTWLDATHLRVECPGCDQGQVKDRDDEWEGVTISYSF